MTGDAVVHSRLAAAYRVQGVGGSVTFTRRPPPAEVRGWPRRLKGCEVSPCTVPISSRREAAAVRPSLLTRIRVCPWQADHWSEHRQGGVAWPDPGPDWPSGEGGGFAVAGRAPGHLLLAPSGRGGMAGPRPGPVRAAGSPSLAGRGLQSESPATGTVRAGWHGQSPGPVR